MKNRERCKKTVSSLLKKLKENGIEKIWIYQDYYIKDNETPFLLVSKKTFEKIYKASK